MLSEIFGRKREEEIKGWRRLHNEELFDLHCTSDIIRMSNGRRISWDWGASVTDGTAEKPIQDFGQKTQSTDRNWKT